MKNKIWILHDKPEVNATLLDDKSLDGMISACAQVLCNVHFLAIRMRGDVSWAFVRMENDSPLPPEFDHDEWSLWGKDCLANYNALLTYAQACCREYAIRFQEIFEDERGQRITRFKKHELYESIEWCVKNKPDLPNCNNKKKACTPWPLVMPDKYKSYFATADGNDINITGINFISSYRNYYCAYLRKMAEEVNCSKCDELGFVLDSNDLKQRGSWKVPTRKICTNCGGKRYISQAPVWTRREQPDWIDL